MDPYTDQNTHNRCLIRGTSWKSSATISKSSATNNYYKCHSQNDENFDPLLPNISGKILHTFPTLGEK